MTSRKEVSPSISSKTVWVSLTLLCLVLPLIYFAWLIWPQGAGVSHDTLVFMEAGSRFWSGEGYTELGESGQWQFCGEVPPLYPLLLSLFSYIDSSGKLLALLLFGLTCYFTLGIVKRYTAKHAFSWQLIAGMVTSLIFLIPISNLFFISLSEALFIPVLLAIFWTFIEHPDWSRRLGLLLLTLTLTRVVGVAIAGSLALTFLLFYGWHRRVWLTLLYGVVPMVLWILLSKTLGEGLPRPIGWHPIGMDGLQLVPLTIGKWLLPKALGIGATGLGMIILLTTVVMGVKAWKERQLFDLLLVLTLWGYLVFLLLSISLLDAATPIEERTLLPVKLTLLILMLTALSSAKDWSKMVFPVLLVLGLMGANVSLPTSKKIRTKGFGYSSVYMHSLEFETKLPAHISEGALYSNDPHAAYFYCKLPVAEFPMRYNRYTRTENLNYARDWVKFIDEVRAQSGTLIWLRNGALGHSFALYDEVKNLPGFEVAFDNWAGLVLKTKR